MVLLKISTLHHIEQLTKDFRALSRKICSRVEKITSCNNYCSRLWSVRIYQCSWTILYYNSQIKTTPSKEISAIKLQNETEISVAHTGFAHTGFAAQTNWFCWTKVRFFSVFWKANQEHICISFETSGIPCGIWSKKYWFLWFLRHWANRMDFIHMPAPQVACRGLVRRIEKILEKERFLVTLVFKKADSFPEL